MIPRSEMYCADVSSAHEPDLESQVELAGLRGHRIRVRPVTRQVEVPSITENEGSTERQMRRFVEKGGSSQARGFVCVLCVFRERKASMSPGTCNGLARCAKVVVEREPDTRTCHCELGETTQRRQMSFVAPQHRHSDCYVGDSGGRDSGESALEGREEQCSRRHSGRLRLCTKSFGDVGLGLEPHERFERVGGRIGRGRQTGQWIVRVALDCGTPVRAIGLRLGRTEVGLLGVDELLEVRSRVDFRTRLTEFERSQVREVLVENQRCARNVDQDVMNHQRHHRTAPVTADCRADEGPSEQIERLHHTKREILSHAPVTHIGHLSNVDRYRSVGCPEPETTVVRDNSAHQNRVASQRVLPRRSMVGRRCPTRNDHGRHDVVADIGGFGDLVEQHRRLSGGQSIHLADLPWAGVAIPECATRIGSDGAVRATARIRGSTPPGRSLSARFGDRPSGVPSGVRVPGPPVQPRPPR